MPVGVYVQSTMRNKGFPAQDLIHPRRTVDGKVFGPGLVSSKKLSSGQLAVFSSWGSVTSLLRPI